jgi:predicted small lipoprotein YifL
MKQLTLLTLGVLLLLAACGQKGALYLPDKNAAVVTSAPAAAPAPAAPAATPAAPKKPDDQDEDSPPPK